jgi:hypothetical protein
LINGHGRVDFLKLDIEGSEMDLLSALADAGILGAMWLWRLMSANFPNNDGNSWQCAARSRIILSGGTST